MGTAAEAGWHESRYNLRAPAPDGRSTIIANLFKATCMAYNPLEVALLDELATLDENHPLIERFAAYGIIANFDERAAIDFKGRVVCAMPRSIDLTICPTMACNFACPYCFENHVAGKMSREVQGDVVDLARRMLDASGASDIQVTWFGGEPLLAPDVIESLSTRFMALAAERGGTYRADMFSNGYFLTQEVADMLGRCQLKAAAISIDGIGPDHDATRHLAGGGPTFDRIISNLRDNHIPFKIALRHNVHVDNKETQDEVHAFIDQIAQESGNNLQYYAVPLIPNDAAHARGNDVEFLGGSAEAELGIIKEVERLVPARGHRCGAQCLWTVAIDELGNLYQCYEAVDKRQVSFGTAHDWDPTNPLDTAHTPDNLTMYFNTAAPNADEECRECVWLPICAGGCPHKRLFEGRKCARIPFRDDPEAYVLALYERMNHRTRN